MTPRLVRTFRQPSAERSGSADPRHHPIRSCRPIAPRVLSIGAALLVTGLAAELPGQQSARARVTARTVQRMHERLTKDLDIWQDHSTFDKAWVVRSQHFEVHTTVSHGVGRDLASGLETMLGHFHKVLGTDYVPPKPLKVFVLPSRAEYNKFGDDHGTDHSSFYGSFFAPGHPQSPVAVEYHANPTLLRMQITHSVVHQFLHFAYPASVGRRPAWIEEGLAAYFTFYWSPEWTREQYLSAKADERTEKMQRILRDNIAAFRNDTEVRFLQLAMFFDYLLRFREDTKSAPDEQGVMRGAFRDYVVAVLDGRSLTDPAITGFLGRTARLIEDFETFEFPR